MNQTVTSKISDKYKLPIYSSGFLRMNTACFRIHICSLRIRIWSHDSFRDHLRQCIQYRSALQVAVVHLQVFANRQ